MRFATSGQPGTATVTVHLHDEGGTAQGGSDTRAPQTLLITVLPPEDAPPTIAAIAARTVAEDASTGAIAVSVADAETPAAALVLTASAADAALVPAAGLVLGGGGADRTLTVTPAADASGATLITLTVSDGRHSVSTSFGLTVTPVDDPPAISDIADHGTAAGVALPPIPFTVADPDTPTGALVVTATSADPTLIPAAGLVVGGSGSDRTVTVTPAPGQAGTAVITIAVSDGTTTASDRFAITVAPPPLDR